jgi:hypothetical protein
MYSPAMIVAQGKINELQAEAAANRLAKKSRSARSDSRGRVSVALSNFRSLLSLDGPKVLPKLTDYPHRS